jgi:dihydroneopterin aldolase
MDRIEVRGISFTGRHGCYPEERLVGGRKFEVDVVVWFDLGKAATSDRLSDTFDYDRICKLVYTIGTTESFHLIERLAQEITDKLFEVGGIERSMVEVRKFVPELMGSPRHVAAVIERERPSTR